MPRLSAAEIRKWSKHSAMYGPESDERYQGAGKRMRKARVSDRSREIAFHQKRLSRLVDRKETVRIKGGKHAASQIRRLENKISHSMQILAAYGVRVSHGR